MTDCPKCTPTARLTPCRGGTPTDPPRRVGSGRDGEDASTDPLEPTAASQWPRTASDDFGIRLAPSPDLCCPRCSAPIGDGPVGCRGVVPVCDDCFVRLCPGLGLVLALVAGVRTFANQTFGAEGAEDPGRALNQALASLMRCVAEFEAIARRWGPPRATHLSGEHGPS